MVSTWRMMVAIEAANDVAPVLDLGRVFALEPLGRQADRGQRVLDLVRDPPRHLGPGRLTLGRQEQR